jgi:predicted O-methyltransferase YrrM
MKKRAVGNKRIDSKTFLAFLRTAISTTVNGDGDSDRHVFPLFSIAVASKAKVIIELGVREGGTTLPLLLAAYVNKGTLISVDKERTNFVCPPALRPYWRFVKSDSLQFLKKWGKSEKVDFIYVDDWHSYEHVKKELEYIDHMVGPSSVVLLHDLMRGNTAPFYHCDLTVKEGQWANGGPYRAVAELNAQFWEWATLPWSNGLTILRKKYSSKYHVR